MKKKTGLVLQGAATNEKVKSLLEQENIDFKEQENDILIPAEPDDYYSIEMKIHVLFYQDNTEIPFFKLIGL